MFPHIATPAGDGHDGADLEEWTPENNGGVRRIQLPWLPPPSRRGSAGAAEPQTATPRKKKQATTDLWLSLPAEYFTVATQRELLADVLWAREHAGCPAAPRLLLEHIRTKISGYKSQDTEKALLSAELFVRLEDVLSLLSGSNLQCYYCREDVKLLYEYVRDPKQWSLERMNNASGHNRDNVVIACLLCNLRRRTMQQERYVVTKQMRIRKLDM
jgi:hypothetical protein